MIRGKTPGRDDSAAQRRHHLQPSASPSVSRRACPGTCRCSPRPRRWARRRSPRRSFPTTPMSTRPRFGATSRASASSASAGSDTQPLTRGPDPQDPADRRSAQHRPARRRNSAGDRLLGNFRRPRLPGGRHVRCDPQEGRDQDRLAVVRDIDELRQRVEDEDIVVGVLAVPSRPRRGSRTSSWRRA